AGEHAGIDQKYFIVKTRPDAPTLLHRMPYHNMRCLISFQELVYLRGPLLVGPLVVAAKPQRTIHPHTQPLWVLQKLQKSFLSPVIRSDPSLALGDNFRLDHGADFLKVEKWQNQFLVDHVLFVGVELLDFLADVAVYGVKFYRCHGRRESAV